MNRLCVIDLTRDRFDAEDRQVCSRSLTHSLSNTHTHTQTQIARPISRGVRAGELNCRARRLDEAERLCEASGRREMWLELGRTALANLDIELGVLLLLLMCTCSTIALSLSLSFSLSLSLSLCTTNRTLYTSVWSSTRDRPYSSV